MNIDEQALLLLRAMKFELGEMDDTTFVKSRDRISYLVDTAEANLIKSGVWKDLHQDGWGEVRTRAICLLMDERDANQAFIDAFNVGETIEKDALRLLIERLLPELTLEPPDDES